MTTKTLRLSDSLLDGVHELGNAEHIEEATAMRKLVWDIIFSWRSNTVRDG